MNEFDELLNEVLHQEANPQPPLEMKKKLIEGISLAANRSRSPIGQRLGVGIAAAIFVGVTMWSLARIRTPVAAEPVARVSLTSGVFPNASGNREAKRPQAAGRSPGREAALVSAAAIRRQPSPERSARSIARVEIESIAIQPIEIAHLNIKKLSQER